MATWCSERSKHSVQSIHSIHSVALCVASALNISSLHVLHSHSLFKVPWNEDQVFCYKVNQITVFTVHRSRNYFYFMKYSPYLKSRRKKLSGFVKEVDSKKRVSSKMKYANGDGLRACVYFLRRRPLSMYNMRKQNAKEEDYHARLSMVFHTDCEYFTRMRYGHGKTNTVSCWLCRKTDAIIICDSAE